MSFENLRKFDINDQDRVIRLIKSRHPDAFVMPLYVRIYNERIDIRDIYKINEFNPSSFSVGFGAVYSMFSNTSFPGKYSYDFTNETAYNMFDPSINNDVRYIVFESTETGRGTEHPLFEQIDYYCNLIRDTIVPQYEEHRRALIESIMNS